MVPSGIRVFLSYGHDVADLAVRLRRDLEAAGAEVWFDEKRLAPGAVWDSAIAEGIDWTAGAADRGCFLLLMTPHSMREDGFCLNELSYAIERRVRVVPILLADCVRPMQVHRLQWLDLRDCLPFPDAEARFEAKFPAILSAVANAAPKPDGSQSLLVTVLRPVSNETDLDDYLQHFTGREWLIERLDSWMNSDGGPVRRLTGPPGSGKSAFAAWLARHRAYTAAAHFFRRGHSDRSNSRRAITSIAFDLAQRFPEFRARLLGLDLVGLVADSNAATLFERLILEPARSVGRGSGRVEKQLVILDAIDEAADSGTGNEFADALGDLISRAPGWLRFIVTSRSGANGLQRLQGLPEEELEPGSADQERDIRQFIDRHLSRFLDGKPGSRKSLVDDLCQRSENLFLYVELVRRELGAGTLTLDRLQDFPKGLGGVYWRYFENEFTNRADYGAVVRPVLEVVAAARRLLSQAELLQITGQDEYEQEDTLRRLAVMIPIRRGLVAPVHSSILDWLTDRGSADRYYVSAARGHARLATYCWERYREGTAGMPAYAKENAAGHLRAAERWPELVAVLSDAPFLREWADDPAAVSAMWAAAEKATGRRMIDSYQAFLADPISNLESLRSVVVVLRHRGYAVEAERAIEAAVTHYRENGAKRQLMSMLSLLAIVRNDTGNRASLASLEEQEALARELNDPYRLANALGNQGVYFLQNGDLETADRRFDAQKEICESLGDQQSLAMNLANRASAALERGDSDLAKSLIEQSEAMYRDVADKGGLVFAVRVHEQIARARGELTEAAKLLDQARDICLETDNRPALVAVLAEKGALAQMRKEWDTAFKSYVELERLCRSIGARDGLARALCGQGEVLSNTGELARALDKFVEAQTTIDSTGRGSSFMNAVAGMARALDKLGRAEESAALWARVEQASRENGNMEPLCAALVNLAAHRYSEGDLDGAAGLLREETAIARGGRLLPLLEAGLLRLADIEAKRTNRQAAIEALTECIATTSRTGNEIVSLEAKFLLGGLMLGSGDCETAFRLALEVDNALGRGLGRNSAALADKPELKERKLLASAALAEARRLRGAGQSQRSIEIIDEAISRVPRDPPSAGAADLWAERSRLYGEAGEFEECLRASREWERMCRVLDLREDVLTAIHNQISALAYLDRRGEARLELIDKQERLGREWNDPLSVVRAYGNRANDAKSNGAYEEALSLFLQQEQAARDAGLTEMVALSLAGQAWQLLRLGRHGEIAKPLKESIELARQERSIGAQKLIAGFFKEWGRLQQSESAEGAPDL